MTTNHSLRRSCPGKTNARRDVLFCLKLGVVVPTQTKVQRKTTQKPPVVLEKYRVVIVPQVDLIRSGCKTADSRDSKEAGVDWTISQKIIDRGEELKIQYSAFSAVNLCTQKVPTKLKVMIAEQFCEIGAERSVLLVQQRGRSVVAKRY